MLYVVNKADRMPTLLRNYVLSVNSITLACKVGNESSSKQAFT